MLAADGDLLWTPEPVPQASLPEHALLPAPRVVHGALPAHASVVPWSVVPGLPRVTPPPALPALPALPLVDALRRAPRPALEVQRRVSHRRFATELADALGHTLPGAVWLDDADALARHLRGLERAPSGWVLKAPLSAAGEGLLLHRAEAPLAASRAERAFAAHGALRFEPWEPRAADFGASAWIDVDGRTHEVGLHALTCSAAGGFRGVTAPAAGAAPAGLAPAHVELLHATLLAAGDALAAAGHRGPFGIDAYLRADPSTAAHAAPGAARAPASHDEPASVRATPPADALRPLVEINARLGFGHLVHALAERERLASPDAAGRGCALLLAGPRAAPPPDATPLVRPVDGRGVWVWGAPAS